MFSIVLVAGLFSAQIQMCVCLFVCSLKGSTERLTRNEPLYGVLKWVVMTKSGRKGDHRPKRMKERLGLFGEVCKQTLGLQKNQKTRVSVHFQVVRLRWDQTINQTWTTERQRQKVKHFEYVRVLVNFDKSKKTFSLIREEWPQLDLSSSCQKPQSGRLKDQTVWSFNN